MYCFTDGNVIWQKPIGDNLELYGERNNTISISKIFAGPDGYFLLGTAYHVHDFYGDVSSGSWFIVSIDENRIDEDGILFDGSHH